MPTPSPDDDLLNRPLLRQLAGDKSFARGEEYFAKGRVRQLHFAEDRVTARVNGSRTYRVKLWRGRGELQFSCNCVVGREETFCKHCVAVGLAWLAGPDGQPDASAGQPSPEEKEAAREPLRRHLRTLERDRLVNLVLEATDYDDILRRRLSLETIGIVRERGTRRAAATQAPDFEAYREILREAVACQDYVDYDTMPDYAQGIEEAIFPFDQLLRAGHASAVIELVEFVLVELDKAAEMVDGGDGSLNPVYDDLQHYHLEACRAAPPDPEKLAARLLHYELEGGLGVFNNAVKTYADILGDRGVAAWRRCLTREWTALPSRATDTPDSSRPMDHRRFQLQVLMERMAESGGDLMALAAVKQRDLSSAHDFLSLAELYQRAGLVDEALAWAERGLRRFPGLPDRAGLRDFAAAAYEGLQRHEEAVALAWEEFEFFHDLEHFRKLRARVTEREAEAWTQWRDRALAQLRGDALIEALLIDGDDEGAWRVANTGGCRTDLWLRLAERREKEHPAEAIRVYAQRVEPIIERGTPHAYQESVELIQRIRTLYERLGRGGDFAAYRNGVRAAHRHRRPFLKLLDALH